MGRQLSGITDFSYLLEFSGNDVEFLKEMIDVFIEKSPYDVERLLSGVQAKDWHLVYQMAHTLKTSTNFMGIKRIKEEVLTVEDLAKNQQDLEQIPSLVAYIANVCSQAVEELKEKRKNL